jgi:hypothetical protein
VDQPAGMAGGVEAARHVRLDGERLHRTRMPVAARDAASFI